MVRLNLGERIKVQWDDNLKQPENEDIAQMMAHDIGSKVKDSVPMLASTYGDLDKESKGIVFAYLAVSLHFLVV